MPSRSMASSRRNATRRRCVAQGMTPAGFEAQSAPGSDLAATGDGCRPVRCHGAHGQRPHPGHAGREARHSGIPPAARRLSRQGQAGRRRGEKILRRQQQAVRNAGAGQGRIRRAVDGKRGAPRLLFPMPRSRPGTTVTRIAYQQAEERRASHILIASEKIGKDKAKAKAEEVLKEVAQEPGRLRRSGQEEFATIRVRPPRAATSASSVAA